MTTSKRKAYVLGGNASVVLQVCTGDRSPFPDELFEALRGFSEDEEYSCKHGVLEFSCSARDVTAVELVVDIFNESQE